MNKIKLPSNEELQLAAETVEEYPASTHDMVEAAREAGCKESTVDFIELFPDDRKDEFGSADEFYTRAVHLAELIREEREQPREQILSPEG